MRHSVHINPDIAAVEELLSPPVSWQHTFQLPQKLHPVSGLQQLHLCKMRLSLFTELDGMTSLAGTMQPHLYQLYLGQISLVTGLCIPGPQGTWSRLKTVLKGISLVCVTTLFAAPHCLVASDAQLPTERCFSLTCLVSSPLGLISFARKKKERFCILEVLRSLQIWGQMLMQR